MKLKRVLVGLAVAVPLALVGIAFATNVFDGIRQATARYHDLTKAESAGYAEFRDAQGIACIDLPGVGAMGVHYVKGSLVGDAVLDANHPEALVYERRGNNMHLVALEYIVFKQVWEDAGNQQPPTMFGRQFNLTPSPNRFGIPAFYSLHAWAWKVNPEGDFFAWNPRVNC
jgi:hypothetical protein